MKIYKKGDYEYWYDRPTRSWWCAEYDKEGNQVGDADCAYTKREIELQIDFLERTKESS